MDARHLGPGKRRRGKEQGQNSMNPKVKEFRSPRKQD